jgi:hypothetical protein
MIKVKMEFDRPLSPLHTNDIKLDDSYSLFPMLDAADEPTNWLTFDDPEGDLESISNLDSNTTFLECTICNKPIYTDVKTEEPVRKKRKRSVNELLTQRQ